MYPTALKLVNVDLGSTLESHGIPPSCSYTIFPPVAFSMQLLDRAILTSLLVLAENIYIPLGYTSHFGIMFGG